MDIKYLFDTSPVWKVFYFLLSRREYDYTISMILQETKISSSTFYELVLNTLNNYQMLNTRKCGKLTMYRINMENSFVKQMGGIIHKTLTTEEMAEYLRKKGQL